VSLSRPAPPGAIDPDRPRLDPEPTYRPEHRFWPYVELPEVPTEEEFAALDPDLRMALFGVPARPFSITLVFPRFEGPDFERALAMAKASRDCQETTTLDGLARIRARFQPDDVEALRDIYQIVGALEGSEVLVDERPVPYARELWLPLLWYLLPR
jgi:hypothetical protein